MARNTNKKIIAGVFALSCAFILASCDKVEALPNNYQNKVVVETSGNTPLYKNEMSVIYDAIASGKSEKVVDELLKLISNDFYGSYYGENGLLEAIKERRANGQSTEKLLAFVKAHKDAYYYEDDSKLVSENYTLDQIAMDRANEFGDYIADEINKHFYNEAKSGSYNDEYGVYREQKLAYSYYSKLYNIDVEDITDEDNYYSAFVTHSFDEKDAGYLAHISDYAEHGNYYKDYIEREIITKIYKDKIVEDYILAKNYSSLGRSYGRNVNIAKLSYDQSNKTFADDLIRKFATKYVLNESNYIFEDSHTFLENAWRGFIDLELNGEKATVVELGSEEENLLIDVGKTKIEPVETGDDCLGTLTAYKDTQLGNLLEDFRKAQDAEKTRFATDEQTSALNRFTESGKHPKERGLISEVLKLAQNNSYTDGWHVKNGGLSELPSDLRDRLFNINVSNTLDKKDYDPSDYNEAKDYVRPLNGSFFLVPSKTEKIDINPLNFIFTDTGSSTFYIVEVCEAPSTAKLNLDNEDGYIKDKLYEPLKCESFAREISRVISTRDSYTTSAYTEVFKNCELIYHDDVLYEYFKSTYPDLFE